MQNSLEILKKKFNLTIETKNLAGVPIDVMEASSNEFTQKLLEDLNIDDPTFNNPFLDMKQISYFQNKGDKYIQAFVPQVLADRENSQNKQSLTTWLNKQQGQNWNSSLLAYTTEVQDAPRSIYYFYLKLLEFMGNLTHTEVDLFIMPTAHELNLPEKGQFSFALDADKEGFSVKFSYEYSIFENMSYVDGYLALVYVGVVTAYAIPAYRDYTLKSKVVMKTMLYESEKQNIKEYYQTQGHFPDEEYVAKNLHIIDEYDYNAEIGELTIYFTAADDASLQHDSVVFVPEIDENDNSVYWECYSTVNSVIMPSHCYTLE